MESDLHVCRWTLYFWVSPWTLWPTPPRCRRTREQVAAVVSYPGTEAELVEDMHAAVRIVQEWKQNQGCRRGIMKHFWALTGLLYPA